MHFTSDFWTEVKKTPPTKLLMSTAFYPQTDGLSEISNNQVTQYLLAFATHHQDQWDTICPLYQCKRQTMRKEIGVVHPRYLWKHLLYTDKAMQPLKHFLQATHIAARRWYLGQYRKDEHLGQGDI
jgi:hypothetical protein